MWRKKQNAPDESGIRIPDAAGVRKAADMENPGNEGVHVESVRKKARHQIVFTAVLFVALFIGMTVYFCHYAIENRRMLFDNDYNSRDLLLEEHNRRGRILASEGEILAESDEDNRRSYPYGNEFCHVVGYSILGGSGIEEYMKYELLHSDIPFASKLECDRNEELYPGNDVYTTLDVQMQGYAYEALGDNRGAVIVTEPSTGRILAMVSKPDYDPNAIAGMWEYFRNDESGQAPLVNRVTQGLYPPGSTFKIVDAVELLQEDPSAIYTFSYNCEDGIYENSGESIHCFDYEHHYQQNLEQAFANSCNSAFASIVTEELDQDRFRRTLRRLLFEGPLPYDLPHSVSRSQLLEDTDISTHNLMQVAIGQGTTEVSPLHMNMITMAVANGGVLMRPYLIEKVCTAEDVSMQEYAPRQAASLMDGETASLVRRLMRGVTRVTYDSETGGSVWGTASEFEGTQTYTAFGKTGTAEFGDDEDSHAWFTGFAVPGEEGEDGTPEICITVLIENGGVGADKAVPVAKNILDRWFGEW
ncbi:MAG: penicillin-binding transpeptidase domain-containing protein [Eubacteriales bacterium]|nr:penicillin-binding protein 2 [Sarcina sp.]MDO4416755.1 penicillin-binding transpeptidase domain-containing protein [Eubacteriales bacterium]